MVMYYLLASLIVCYFVYRCVNRQSYLKVTETNNSIIYPFYMNECNLVIDGKIQSICLNVSISNNSDRSIAVYDIRNLFETIDIYHIGKYITTIHSEYLYMCSNVTNSSTARVDKHSHSGITHQPVEIQSNRSYTVQIGLDSTLLSKIKYRLSEYVLLHIRPSHIYSDRISIKYNIVVMPTVLSLSKDVENIEFMSYIPVLYIFKCYPVNNVITVNFDVLRGIYCYVSIALCLCNGSERSNKYITFPRDIYISLMSKTSNVMHRSFVQNNIINMEWDKHGNKFHYITCDEQFKLKMRFPNMQDLCNKEIKLVVLFHSYKHFIVSNGLLRIKEYNFE